MIAVLAALLGIGINYNWYHFTLMSLHDCQAQQQPRSVGTWILPQYDDPHVRSVVDEQLRAMHRAGFTSLRIMDFYDHTTDAHADDSFTSTDGRIRPADQKKLANFVADIAAAGFTTLEVVPSFQAENWLYCRNKVWGDCFDSNRTNENWRFIEETTRTVLAARGSLDVRFDLGNEAAPDPHMPAQTLAKARAYIQSIATRFQREFASDWTFSAARSDRSTATETGDRLSLLVDDLARVGLHPKYLELHLYTADGNDLQTSLTEADALARRIQGKLVLGELRYHSDVQASAIKGWLEKHPNSTLITATQWPEYDPSQICAIDPVPPYTPGPRV